MTKVGQIIRQALVKNIKSRVEKSDMTFVVTYSKVSASRMGILRKTLKKIGADVHVSRNRIARIALKELNQETLAGTIAGQTAFISTNADAVAVSKELVKFSKECETAQIKGGLLTGGFLSHDDVKRLSELPAREVLLSQLLGVMTAPIQRLLAACNAKSRDLLSILKQYSEKKGGN